jgi:hypothetical protein
MYLNQAFVIGNFVKYRIDDELSVTIDVNGERSNVYFNIDDVLKYLNLSSVEELEKYLKENLKKKAYVSGVIKYKNDKIYFKGRRIILNDSDDLYMNDVVISNVKIVDGVKDGEYFVLTCKNDDENEIKILYYCGDKENRIEYANKLINEKPVVGFFGKLTYYNGKLAIIVRNIYSDI